MFRGLSIKSVVRKLSLSTGLYRPGLYARLTSKAKREQFRREAAFYAQMLQPDDLCFDVGANVGERSETLLNAGMRVVAFEPQKVCVTQILARCRRFGDRLKIYQGGLGAEIGEATLYTNVNTVVSSLRKDWDTFQGSTRIPVTTLDHAIATYGRPAYCKIDVEGWELEVLKGLTQPLPLVSVEYHFKRHVLENTFACLERLAQFGNLRINITPAEELAFTSPEWLPLKDFLKVFPSSFENRVEYHYGDLFIRTEL